MSPHYYELLIEVSSELKRFTDFISEIYDEGFEESQNTLIIRSEDSLEDLIWGVEEFSQELSKVLKKDIKVKTTLTEKENKDWIENYKKSISPINVDEFYIRASWHMPKDGFTDIVIDPALAFGSGHHESTLGCIKTLLNLELRSKKVLDIGCGSGILSIIASKKGASISMCDTDPLAIEESVKNLKLNAISDYDIREGSVNSFEDSFEIVVANISADILDALHNEIVKKVQERGYLIASGIIEDKLERVKSRYKEFAIQNILQLNDWFTILLKKDNNG